MLLLSNLLRRFILRGRLSVIDHCGARHDFGTGLDGPGVTIRLFDKAVEREIFLNPELKAAEVFMNGRLVMEGGTPVFDLLHLFSVNRSGLAAHPVQQALRRGRRTMRRWQQRNPLGKAAENARPHYDILPDFYRLFLDPTMNYSCAYYPTPDATLRFCRMWDFYLASVELSFLNGSNFVFQLLLSERREDVPVTRDFIFEEERRLAALGAA